MESSPSSSIEKQIDHFLEHFKRSASKAIDAEWGSGSDIINNGQSGSPQRQAPLQRLLQKTKSRSSCLDVSELSDNDVETALAESQAIVMSASQTQQRQQQQQLINHHMIDSQISVSSGASIQTAIFQSLSNSPAHTNRSTGLLQHTTSTISSNSTTSVNSQGVAYAAEALNTQRPVEPINSLLEHISPAQAAAAMSGEGVLNIADVADLLHPQHAIITGGRSQEGCPLIIFPDNNNFNAMEEADYQKLILYLSSVPSLQDADLGFHLIIDRRKDRWTSVKTALQRISIYFPGIIHVVYVLRPSGLFQKAISEVSSKFSSKDEYRFRLVICSALSDLHEFVDATQLTPDMGGSLIYSHHEWIQQRISLEKFSSLTHQVSAELDVFIQAIHDTEFPNSVEATRKLLEDQGADYARLKDEILAAARHGETLLNKIKSNDELKEFSERTGNVSSIERSSAGQPIQRQQIIYHQQYKIKQPQHYDDCRDYRRLLVQLEETERRFDEFWRTHRNRLEQCLRLRMFEQDFRELQNIFDGHLKTVADMTEIGESVERVATLIQDTEQFRDLIKLDVEHAETVIQTGQQLVGSRGVYPWEIVQPKCDELQRVCDIINMRLTKRLEILAKNSELMERVEKANQWCANGVELLASQRIEKCSVSADLAEQSLHEIQAFIASASDFKLSTPSEFKKIFLESTTPETKALVSQVLQRIDDVSLMCDKRIASLKKLALKPPRPVQQVTPEPAVPLQPPGGAPHLLRRKQIKTGIHELRPRSMDGVIDSGSLNSDTSSSPDNGEHAMQNQQDAEARRLKRGHVLSELLETERIYVNEMSSILKGYCDQMQSDELMHLVPASLQGKEEILFGNLHELYTFHNEVFLKDLENCISTTELVALCFVQRRDTFYRLYSFYCQNIPRSERLRETLVDTHLFLQECQKRLGHKLPLAAYLLKPVQRITKYQLLLKDLLRFSDSGSCTKELQKALDCMLIVLKCVNDSMHQVAITGFPTDLAQQGELLLQDSFQVWTESKKDIRLRIKPQQRHIFLYQKSLLFCKQTSKTGHNKSTYQFKHHVKMSQIGLTESVRGDTKRFEVWLQGRQEVHTMQAPTLDVKNKWVAEIKRVLLNQLEELKGEKIKQYGLNHRGLKQTTSWDTPNIILSSASRTISCDASSESSNRNSNCSTEENGSAPVGGTNSSGSGIGDREHQEACGWSSDYSNSEDELSLNEDNSTPSFLNVLAQWATYNADRSSSSTSTSNSYARSNKSNSKFYVSVD
ncbi:guanine nucleotide exchange factor DBS isoform X3 [Drosophila albomicans]|uniref:Guanine nucleotide exchange factor DBS isoform X3 n=1 Tax=Drosophila albomicans TaxID=7291 RepID=A0A9C6SPY7_DROAB|nr:guanine nucleotide exchange factor DBS isoform X3 [Drosophila albomicans]XP_051859899.1 guanine nucleotide exchange factor DBS isoform X3 [Drosophila albomicans]